MTEQEQRRIGNLNDFMESLKTGDTLRVTAEVIDPVTSTIEHSPPGGPKYHRVHLFNERNRKSYIEVRIEGQGSFERVKDD